MIRCLPPRSPAQRWSPPAGAFKSRPPTAILVAKLCPNSGFVGFIGIPMLRALLESLVSPMGLEPTAPRVEVRRAGRADGPN